MKLTQEIIDKIQEAMLHTKKDGTVNWKDDDEIEVQLAGEISETLMSGALGNYYEHSDAWYDYKRNDPNAENPFTDPKDRERAERVVNGN